MQWSQQREYIMSSWNVGWFIGTLFVIVNLLGQLIPCGMILARKKTDIACGILFFIIALQVSFDFVFLTFTINLLSHWHIELYGSLVLCLGKR
jgi:hypothetical protein